MTSGPVVHGGTVPPKPEAASTTVATGQVTLSYVLHPQGAYLLTVPYLAFDVAIAQLRFGQLLMVQQVVGDYAQVLVGAKQGFVLAAALTANRELVWPHFEQGHLYDTNDRVTVVVRHHLQDMFGAGVLALPLQAGEYIVMRLLKDNLTIPFTAERPRLPGQWHQLLRGVRGVHSGVVPQTDSIMEWVGEDGEGRLAYVEAVLPDTTVRVSGVGVAVPGEYSTLLFRPEVWREWRPVFMTVQ